MPMSPEEDMWSPGTRILGHCEAHNVGGCWEQTRVLEEHQELTTAEPFLYPKTILFKMYVIQFTDLYKIMYDKNIFNLNSPFSEFIFCFSV